METPEPGGSEYNKDMGWWTTLLFIVFRGQSEGEAPRKKIGYSLEFPEKEEQESVCCAHHRTRGGAQ